MVLKDYALWADGHFPATLQVAHLCIAALEQCRSNIALDSPHSTLCFCRADARFANVIERPGGRVALVDWEDSGLRDPARDMADLLTAADQEDLLAPADWKAFLDPYFAARSPFDPGLPDRSHLYLRSFVSSGSQGS